jgi:hypothetical protein
MVAGCYDICGFFNDEEEDGSHKRRQGGGPSSAARRGVTYRGLFSYITNPRHRHRRQRRVDVLFARQTTDLDAGAGRQGACRSPDGNWGAGPRPAREAPGQERDGLSWQPIIRRGSLWQSPMGFIDGARKYKPSGEKVGAAASRSRASSTNPHPFGRLVALPNPDQATHDVADHVVQEGVGLEVKTPVGTAAGNVDAAEGLDWRQRLAATSPKGGKIMLPPEMGDRLSHGRTV